jgi:DNA-binding transcriptional ArsR family regulator
MSIGLLNGAASRQPSSEDRGLTILCWKNRWRRDALRTYYDDEIIEYHLENFVINSLPPDLLRSFVAVAQTKSFSRAAERMNLSQSTVSQQIRRLEDLVGKSLFERDTRTVTLTRDGEAFQNYAARILDLMSEAVEHFHASG